MSKVDRPVECFKTLVEHKTPLRPRQFVSISMLSNSHSSISFNLKTAKALGLTIPLPLIGRADEVIE